MVGTFSPLVAGPPLGEVDSEARAEASSRLPPSLPPSLRASLRFSCVSVSHNDQIPRSFLAFIIPFPPARLLCSAITIAPATTLRATKSQELDEPSCLLEEEEEEDYDDDINFRRRGEEGGGRTGLTRRSWRWRTP